MPYCLTKQSIWHCSGRKGPFSWAVVRNSIVLVYVTYTVSNLRCYGEFHTKLQGVWSGTTVGIVASAPVARNSPCHGGFHMVWPYLPCHRRFRAAYSRYQYFAQIYRFSNQLNSPCHRPYHYFHFYLQDILSLNL